jgi:selenocysteine lyase/cysteine desulfurase
MVANLDAKGIGTSCRDGNLRVSMHLYNSDADIDTCLQALQQHRALLV